MIEIRDLHENEAPFVADMTYAAIDWNTARELPPKEAILAHPLVVIFHEEWGRDGDVALVVAEHERLVGLVWCRRFTETAHGEGFVDEKIPELAVAVCDGYRGRGLGRRLMEAMHERLRADGVARVSLSVDADNPAKRLYASLGYRDFEPGDGLGRMVLDLR